MRITMLEDIIAQMDIQIQLTEDVLSDLKNAKEILRQRIVLLHRARGENLP